MRLLLCSALLAAALFASAALAPAASAQDAPPRMAPATAQVMLGGEGIFGGLLADYFVTPKVLVRAGVSQGFGLAAPLFVTYNIGARRSKLEVGGGVLVLLETSEEFESTPPVAWVGYRRQPGPGGLLFRAGAIVAYDGEDFFPIPGVALGIGIGKPRR